MALPKTQQDLLDAMKSGVVVHFMSGIDAFYFRSDNFRRCSAAAEALIDKGYARRVGQWSTQKLELLEPKP